MSVDATCGHCQGDVDTGRVVLCSFHVAAATIGNLILDIMKTYHEQEKRGYVDTPGGLEHMGDVWGLFTKWEHLLKTGQL